jgi:peroxiredoxin
MMPTENLEATEQQRQGRNSVILFGGSLLLVIALAFLLFGGRLFDRTEPARSNAVEPEAPEAAVLLPESGPPLQVGDQPYEFTLSALDGQTVTLSQFIGRPILINFWATWCGPCRLEMPEIQAIWEEHRDEGLVVLALDQDETAADVRVYFDELGLTFTALLDEDSRTARNFGLQGTLPSSVFVNPDGEISVIHRGLMTRGQLDNFLAQTLGD